MSKYKRGYESLAVRRNSAPHEQRGQSTSPKKRSNAPKVNRQRNYFILGILFGILITGLLVWRLLFIQKDDKLVSIREKPGEPFESLDSFLRGRAAISPATRELLRPTGLSVPGGVYLELFNSPRVPGTANHTKVRDAIVRILRADLNIESVIVDSFNGSTPYGTKLFSNIIATVNPQASRRIIFSAHYDSKYFANFEFIGAIDSAVPCAILLEIAAFVQANDRLLARLREMDFGLQFVFFDGEEAFKDWSHTDSLYGANHLAAKWQKEDNLKQIKLLVLLDLIGAANPSFFPLHRAGKPFFDRVVQLEWSLYKNGLFMQDKMQPYFNAIKPAQVTENAIEDDHIPFYNRNVPILHLIPIPFPGQWHQSTDNFKTLDSVSIESMTIIMKSFVLSFANLFE